MFAAAGIPKGTAVWRWDAAVDREIPWDTANALPGITREFLQTYGYRNAQKKMWMLGGDNARFMNHSFSPNTKSGGPYGPDLALRDIKAGEELTVDYRLLDPEFDVVAAKYR